MMPAMAQADLAVTFVEPARQEFRLLQGCMTSITGSSSTACSKALHFVQLKKNLLTGDSFSNSKTQITSINM